MKRFIALFFLLLTMPAFAQVDCTWNFLYFTGTSNGVRRVEIAPVSWGINGNNIITPDRIRYTNDGSGSLTVSNMATNINYRVEFQGSFATFSITNYFPPGTAGAVNAAAYVTASLNAGGVVAYSQGQANAKFAVKTNALFYGSEPKLNGTNFSDLYGGSGGTTLTNNATGSAGMINGSGISSNLTGYVTTGTNQLPSDHYFVLLGEGGLPRMAIPSNDDADKLLNVPVSFGAGSIGSWTDIFRITGTGAIGNGAGLTNIGTNSLSAAAHAEYVNTGLATAASVTVVSNQNLRSFSGMQRDNPTLALSLDMPTRSGANGSIALPTNGLHGLLYVPANQTTRTTNYLIGICRLTTNGVIIRADADRMTNLISQSLTGAGLSYPSAIVRIGDFAYFNVAVDSTNNQGIVRWDILGMTYTTICTNLTVPANDGGLATDGTNLFLTGNSPIGFLTK